MTGTPVKGTFGVALESGANPGRYPILPQALILAAQSATNQPIGSTGMRLSILVQGVSNGTPGSITITGKKTDGVTVVTETTTTINLANLNGAGFYDYTTSAVFGSIDASGITATGTAITTSSSVTVWGIQAGKVLYPANFKADEDFDEFSPQDDRGLLDEDVRITQMNKHVTWELDSAVYPESSQWMSYGAVGNVTNPSTPTAQPTSPGTSLMASTAFSAAPFSLATQPKAPGQILMLVLAGNALAGTITVTGTLAGTGTVVTETFTITVGTPNPTLYSQNVYASVNASGITKTGLTSTGTLVVTGIYDFNPVFLPTDSLATLAGEWYSGTESSVFPFMVVQDWEIDYEAEKEMQMKLKGMAQDKLSIGDRTLANLTTSNFPTYAQPIDYPLVGPLGLFYIDPVAGPFGTTQSFDILKFKIKGNTGLKPYMTANGSVVYQRVGRKRRKTQVEIEVDFTNLLQYEKYKTNTKQVFVCKFVGPYIGVTVAGALQYKVLQFTLPIKMTKFQIEDADEKKIGKISGVCEYEGSLGYSFKMEWVNQNNPNYAS